MAVALAAAVMAAVVWPLRERTPALTVPLGVRRLRAVLWALGGIDRRTLEALRRETSVLVRLTGAGRRAHGRPGDPRVELARALAARAT